MLRYLLMGLIRLYWIVMPKAWRKECIFRTSCSKHVYAVTSREGFSAGLSALKSRWRGCRPGYRIEWWDGEMKMCLADGSFVDSEHISEEIFSQYETAFNKVEARIMAANARF